MIDKQDIIETSKVIYNNTLYGNPGGGIRISMEKRAQNIAVINNILSDNGSSQIFCNGNVTNFMVKNNLYWNPASIGSGVKDSSPVMGHPHFANPAIRDFRLAMGSVAIGKGECLSRVTTDKDGRPRPTGSGCDMGAYQYGREDTTSLPAP